MNYRIKSLKLLVILALTACTQKNKFSETNNNKTKVDNSFSNDPKRKGYTLR